MKDIVKEAQATYIENNYDLKRSSTEDLLYMIVGKQNRPGVTTHIVKEFMHLVNVYGLYELTYHDLIAVNGIGDVLASRILSSLELGKRVDEIRRNKNTVIRSPEEAASRFSYLKHKNQETLIVLFLNAKNVVIDSMEIYQGGLSQAYIHPREIYKEAIRRSAFSIILGHNHPSQDHNPSQEDINVTRRIHKAGELLGISLLDHIVIGGNGFTSLKSKGYL